MSLQKLNNDQLFIKDEKREAIDFVRTVIREGFPALVVRQMREKFAMNDNEIATISFDIYGRSHTMNIYIYDRSMKKHTRSYDVSIIKTSESCDLLVTYGYNDFIDEKNDEFCAYKVHCWDEDENAFYSDYNYYSSFIELCDRLGFETYLVTGCFAQLVKDKDRLNYCLDKGYI